MRRRRCRICSSSARACTAPGCRSGMPRISTSFEARGTNVKLISRPLAPLLLLAVLATAAAMPVRAQTPPPPPAPPTTDALQAQLEAAQKQLEESARQVAQLSEQMGSEVMQRVMP